jgi:hypothetical protein
MNPLAADQTLTLQAFQAAVDTYQQRGLALPPAIAAIAPTLEPHIHQLDALSEIDPTFEMLYQTARSALQTQSSQRAKFLDTSAYPATDLSHQQSSAPFHWPAPDAHSTSNGHTTRRDLKPSPASPPIKRFVLPLGHTEAERHYFGQYIRDLQHLNPQWVVAPDHCRPGEADAYVMLYHDENYSTNHAVYLIDQILNQSFT